ncbi:MAG: hypothetical protein C0603_12555 [Denitrovibrio sp.]|nr:MAG: hypothetical protein C0603_12555 [Denitrovibrio sp.]
MKKTPIIIACAFILGLAVVLMIFIKVNMPKQYKIAVLNYSPAGEQALAGLTQGLARNGYVQGKNLELIYNGVKTDKKLLKIEAEKLIKEKPDLIYTISTPSTLIMKELTAISQTPIVFGPVSTPEEVGIIDNMKEPGGNITGVTFGPQEPRRFEMMIKLDPDIKDVLIPYNPNDLSPIAGVKMISDVAEKLGITIKPLKINGTSELETKLYGYTDNFDAIFTPTDAMIVSQTALISKFAISKNVPFSCPQTEGVKLGALFAYGFSVENVGIQAARVVHMILSGTNPGSIPIELADFTLAINLNTADKIGIKVPQYLLKNSFIVRD